MSTATLERRSLNPGKAVGKFTALFDGDWARTKSRIRSRGTREQTYDPSYSWDAKTDDPRSFSKMDATDVIVQPSRPITLSHKQVIPLEPLSGQFLNHAPPHELKGLNKIPLAPEQKDLDMRQDLHGHIPIAHEAKEKGHLVSVKTRPVFRNNHLQAPTFQTEEKPEYMIKAGPQNDQILLNPAQRREIIEIEKREKEAHLMMKDASAKRAKTKKIITGPLFKRGVIQLDSAEHTGSDIYGEQARKEQNERYYRSQIHLERRSQLGALESSIATNGDLTKPGSVAARVKVNSDYQSKGGDFHALSFEETHNRLFCRQERAGGAGRTQRIRDAELSGKQYNIVTMTTIEHWPSRHFDRLENKTLSHPSQTSLHGSRNLQGSIHPY